MGKGIIRLDSSIISSAAIVGKKEHDGPLGGYFDMYSEDDRFDCDTWESAESELQRRTFGLAMNKVGCAEKDIGILFAGDLLNQCVGASYGLLDFDIPYMGIYGACSNAAEGMMLASVMTTYGIYKSAAVVTSSHFCSAERQYRTPLEYGSQRTPTAQRTVTGAGAFIIGRKGSVRITEGLPGIVREKGISDAANMGAAMAPAALDTLVRYFSESGKKPNDFDMILTGDLGREGSEILCDLASAEGYDISKNYDDCGLMIYSSEPQDVHAGGSGCGCSASVIASYIIPKLERGELERILFVGTGAMMSPSSLQQGLPIPAIAHLVCLSGGEEN